MARGREEPLALVEAYGFWVNASFRRQFAYEHKAAQTGFLSMLMILFRFTRGFRAFWAIHFLN
jgi:hypothetical protein